MKLPYEKIKNWIATIKPIHLVAGFIFLGIMSFFLDQKENTTPVIQEDPTSVDTYIPEGMTLVPIEIQNIEALKNILSNFGVVDLYLPSYESHRAPKKIASGVKIMRAPLNPDVFAVLVRTEDASTIAQHPGAFFATVLNPKAQGSQFTKEKKQRKTQIVTEI